MTAVIEGLGTAVPERIVGNEEFVDLVPSPEEWIRSRTGVASRRMVEVGTATSDLAVEAGARAMKSAGNDDVDAVVLATTTPDWVCPSTAPTVASQLGLGTVAAFDVNGVCTGFLYGLAAGAGLLAIGVAERVLMIAADTLTLFLDRRDRSTAALFGDGAGAVILRAGDRDEPGAVGPFDLGSNGAHGHLVGIPAGGSRRPATHQTVEGGQHCLTMDGRQIYREAIPAMADSSLRVLGRADKTAADVDRFVAHQANARIIEKVAERLGVPAERCAINIHRYGNTAGASIPLALADADLRAEDLVLMSAFGGGTTWGSALMTWPVVEPA